MCGKGKTSATKYLLSWNQLGRAWGQNCQWYRKVDIKERKSSRTFLLQTRYEEQSSSSSSIVLQSLKTPCQTGHKPILYNSLIFQTKELISIFQQQHHFKVKNVNKSSFRLCISTATIAKESLQEHNLSLGRLTYNNENPFKNNLPWLLKIRLSYIEINIYKECKSSCQNNRQAPLTSYCYRLIITNQRYFIYFIHFLGEFHSKWIQILKKQENIDLSSLFESYFVRFR